jgi:uncharacterized delta-60 repeat protein
MRSSSTLYAAGYSAGSGTDYDFTVVSLADSGVERWVYRYDGPGSGRDEANSIILGSDDNLYAAGYSVGSGTDYDFTVVSLTDSGSERWVYRYNGPASTKDVARSVVMGPDGNLYAAGYSEGSGTLRDLAVVSLTATGVERWVYRYDGPGNMRDEAYSIAFGSDGNLYVGGYSAGSASGDNFTVVSLTTAGVERWIYRYFHGISDVAHSIVMGSDGNLYAAGCGDDRYTHMDFVVVSLTDSGVERWVYRYDGPASIWDKAFSIALGSDGNLYAAGYSQGSGTEYDFTVVSLTDSGVERWVYRYDGPGGIWDEAFSIVTGLDGNIYAAGYSMGSGTSGDLTVVSLADSGVERWVYRYDGPGNGGDGAYSIVAGPDGNLYAAGYSQGSGTSVDLIVVSFAPDVGVDEALDRPSASGSRLWQNTPNPFHHSTVISYSLPAATHVTLSIYDITGRLVETLVNEVQQPGVHQVRWERKSNPSGVYFYRLEAGEFVETRKMVVVE